MKKPAKLPILVVEDDPNLREAVCDTLELAGEAVVSAGSGEEALELLAQQSVALVVSDVRMMPMDGITLLKEISQRLPHLLHGAHQMIDFITRAALHGHRNV